MHNDSSVYVTPNLVIGVTTPRGAVQVKLTRLNAQAFAAALRALAGLPSKGIELNATTFRRVGAEAVVVPKKSGPVPVVRLSGKRGAIYL